ncbi:MAG: RNA polymerase sigma factor, partial [Planctomycetota bacterium]
MNEPSQLNPVPSPGRVEALLAHTDWVQRLARRLVGDPHEADEIVQEAWVQALERPPEHDGNLRGWLARVVRRSIYRRRHAALVRSDHEADKGGPPPVRTPAALATEVAIQRELQGAVLALPEAYRDVLLLRYFEDLPPRRIAERTGAPLATVKSRLHRGTEMLRSQLDQHHGSRTEWMLALVPLASKAAIGETVATAVGLGVAGSLGVAAIIGGTLVMLRVPDAAPETADEGSTALDSRVVQLEPNGDSRKKAGASTADGGKTDRRDGRRELTPTAAPLPPSSAASDSSAAKDERAVSSTLITGVAVELDGIPAPHVRMRRQSKDAVRWQSGDRGWISGPGGSRRISREDEERAREDRDFARRLLKDVKNVKEWRATLLDAPLPGRDQRTSLAGTFQFDTGETLEPLSIEVADPGWIELAFGERTLVVDTEDGEDAKGVQPSASGSVSEEAPPERRELAWVVAKAHRIEAEVRNASGEPLGSGRARVAFDVA